MSCWTIWAHVQYVSQDVWTPALQLIRVSTVSGPGSTSCCINTDKTQTELHGWSRRSQTRRADARHISAGFLRKWKTTLSECGGLVVLPLEGTWGHWCVWKNNDGEAGDKEEGERILSYLVRLCDDTQVGNAPLGVDTHCLSESTSSLAT